MGLKKKLSPSKIAEQMLVAKKRAATNRKNVPKPKPKVVKPKEPPVIVNKPTDFIKISEKATREERDDINKKIVKGELISAFYGVDGKIGYHYYRKIKNGG